MKKTLPKRSFVFKKDKEQPVGRETNMRGDKQKPAKSMVGLRAKFPKIR